MAHTFTHSRVVIRRLAQETARTPPSEEDSPFEYVDRSLTILGRISDMHGERLRQEFAIQREFTATQITNVETKVDARFNEVDARFKEVDARFDKVDARFKEVDVRFTQVDRKIEEVEKKIDEKMRKRLGHMQNATRNSLRTRGWEQIYPVGSFDAEGGVCTPDHFPRTVKQFWGLKDSSRVHRLIRLIRFYNIQGYEEWGTDTDSLEGDGDSDDSSESSSKSPKWTISLETAVRSHPEIAHRALAMQLGLVYDGIQTFMERAQVLSRAPGVGTKRAQGEQEEQTSGYRRSRSFKMSPEASEVTSPTEPRSSQGRPT